MTSQPEPSAPGGQEHALPGRRFGVLRFQRQVNAIDDLIYDYDPSGTGSAPGDEDDAYEGLSVAVMRVLRDAEIRGGDQAQAVHGVVARASRELVTRIVQAWDEG